MAPDDVMGIVKRWNEEPEFRRAMRADPEGTIRAQGVELTDHLKAALAKIDWKRPDEELMARQRTQAANFWG